MMCMNESSLLPPPGDAVGLEIGAASYPRFVQKEENCMNNSNHECADGVSNIAGFLRKLDVYTKVLVD